MDSDLIESIAEATDVPLSPLSRIRLGVDNYFHYMVSSAQRRWDSFAIPRRIGPLGRIIEFKPVVRHVRAVG